MPTDSPKVLVVDDERAITGFIRLVLEEDRYCVRTAVNGRDALHSIELEEPDVLLLDLSMPVMTGWELLEELRQRHMRIPTVIMTAGYRAAVEAERNGADAYLAKP